LFTIAHLSDPHLAPVPVPMPWQVLNKRFTSYIAWLHRNRHVHRPELLAAMVKDLKTFDPDHIVVTDVHTIKLPGKKKRMAKRTGGLTSDRKKAVVTLGKGQVLEDYGV